MVPKANEWLDKEKNDDNGTKYRMAVVMELERLLTNPDDEKLQ